MYNIITILRKENMTMYKFKSNYNSKINKTKASSEIGISRPYLSFIMNGKKCCSKVIAYCITKYLDNNAEINDYFVKIVGD